MLPTLDKLREDLHREYSLFSERGTWMESWKGKSKDQLCFWDQQKTRFPLLSLLITCLMKIDVTNVNVERSMKTLSHVVNPLRSKLGLAKVNEEMSIKFNRNSETKSIERHERLQQTHSKFELHYTNLKITREHEADVIHRVDNLASPTVNTPNTMESPQPVRKSRKTKEFELIENNPDYLPKKRSTRVNRTAQLQQIDEEDEDDEDYFE
jgi:hypothetical protein